MNVLLGDGVPLYSLVVEIIPNTISSLNKVYGGGSCIDNSQDAKNPDGSVKFNTVMSGDKNQILDYITANNISDPNDFLTPFNS